MSFHIKNQTAGVITAGTLHEVATPDEIATLRELNLSSSIGGRNNAPS